MKTILILFLGVVLIVAGTAVLTYQGITVTTAERQIFNVGPLQAGTQQANWTITLPPILGAVLLVAGTALVFIVGARRRLPVPAKDARSAAGSRLTEQNVK